MCYLFVKRHHPVFMNLNCSLFSPQILIFDAALQAGRSDWLVEMEAHTAHDHPPFPVNNSFQHMVSFHHCFNKRGRTFELEFHPSDTSLLLLEPPKSCGTGVACVLFYWGPVLPPASLHGIDPGNTCFDSLASFDMIILLILLILGI